MNENLKRISELATSNRESELFITNNFVNISI